MLNLTLASRVMRSGLSLCAASSSLLLGFVFAPQAQAQDISGYTMTVEEHAVDGIAGSTTYRFYIDMVNATDFLSSIYGNDTAPFYINTSDGFYNDAYATGSTAGGVNPIFYAVFPSLEFDSWVTIGIEGAPVPPQTAISAVESLGQPWLGCFSATSGLSGTNVAMDDFTGGAWYVLNGTPNGLPNSTTMRTLFLQITTSGTLDGTINAQVFPLGVGSDQIQLIYTFDGAGVYSPTAAPSECDDAAACNFGELADCTYPDAGYNCDGTCVSDTDGDGVCDELEVGGCNDLAACNFDVVATDNDGSCVYPETYYDCDGVCLNDADGDGICNEFEAEGCMDDTACNFAPAAVTDDGSCEYTSCVGCTNEAACNYDPTATQDDGSCAQAETGYDCDGNCLSDVDSDGVCDANEIVGCSDDTACNYNADATDDGDCTYAESGYDCDGNCLNDSDMDGVCDENEIEGCDDEAACNYDASATDDDGSCVYPESGYDCDGNCVNDADMDGVCDEFEVAGCADGMACNYNADATDDDGSCFYPNMGYDCDGNCLSDFDMDGVCDEFEVPGCDDSMACNFNEDATENDGSCTYPETGYTCDGSCINDADMDGVCDEFEVAGCQDSMACNYDENATDSGDCTYAEAGYDCDGNCLNDADMDGVCDEFEVAGCTDENAPNYNPDATDDDGSCIACDLIGDAAISNVTCAGGADGFIDVAFYDNTGEAGAIVYALDGNEQTSGLFSGLAAGTYTVVATAENGCSVSIELMVEEPEALSITVDAVGDETEAGAGSIEVTVTGGTEPYVFAWTGENDFTSADEDLSGLVAGTYELTVYDNFQCSTTATVEVDDVLNIEDLNGLTWSAYPNPAATQIWLDLGADVSAAIVQATDLQGRAVFCQEALVISGLLEVQVSHWAAGTYVLNVSAGDQNWTTQVVVQH